MSEPTPQVLIAGAGIAGLVAGLALLQRGIDVEIFEQASELRELGAGVQLSANGTRVLIALGLEQEMLGIASEPSASRSGCSRRGGPGNCLISASPRARSMARRTGWFIAAIFIACWSRPLLRVRRASCIWIAVASGSRRRAVASR